MAGCALAFRGVGKLRCGTLGELLTCSENRRCRTDHHADGLPFL